MLRRVRWCFCRRLIRRRHRCGVIAFFGSLAIISFCLSIASFLYAFRHDLFDVITKCTDKESLDQINAYCQLYKEGKITGSLCQPLCETGRLQFKQCTNFHAGKHVSIMSCSDYCVHGESVPAVLKYHHPVNSTMLLEVPDVIPDAAMPPNFHKEVNRMIKEMLHLELWLEPFLSETDFLEVMWERDYARYTQTADEVKVAYRTVMMLMAQTEYLFVKAFEKSGIVPHIYGTCGPMYLQESCPPGLLDVTPISITPATSPPPTWQQTATAVIQLLQLILQLEQHFPEVLHLCDVKGSNFGQCADGSVKLIDADSAFFDSNMMRIFNTSNCSTHSDCHFFDCGGWCNIDSGQCLTVITNNNLQTVCRDILTTAFPDILDWRSPLFVNAPAWVAPKLKALLKECKEQTSTEQGSIPVHKPPISLLTRILHLLMTSVARDTL